MDFKDGLNVIVGDNEVGKSTILEAIHLALTGMINGKFLNTELTQYLFNRDAVEKYVNSRFSSVIIAHQHNLVREVKIASFNSSKIIDFNVD